MIEIYPKLFIGNENDYEHIVKYENNWNVIHACKDPYHRRLLGYTTRGAPKNHPEYYYAERGPILYLNLIDPNNPEYIPKIIIDKALNFIDISLKNNFNVLVHCNLGESRAPSIGLLYLLSHSDFFFNIPKDMIFEKFKEIYPVYRPSNGMKGYILINYPFYFSGEFK